MKYATLASIVLLALAQQASGQDEKVLFHVTSARVKVLVVLLVLSNLAWSVVYRSMTRALSFQVDARHRVEQERDSCETERARLFENNVHALQQLTACQK